MMPPLQVATEIKEHATPLTDSRRRPRVALGKAEANTIRAQIKTSVKRPG
jgi:hypothetical protein